MNLRLFASAACIVAMLSTPVLAQTQSQVGDQNAGTAPASVGSNSASNSNSNAAQNLINGGSSANNGGVTVGPDTATSSSTSGALSGSVSGATSTGGSSDSHASATGGSATTGASTSNATNAASNAGNAQNLTLNSVNPSSVRTVPTVYAPALTTTLTETCMGSTTAGGSWLGGGLSIGSTWEDKSCKRRLNARELAQTLGDREAARAVLCGDADIADAYERLGRPCPHSPSYKTADAASYVPQLPTPPAPLPPAPPVIVNVPAPAAPQMAPIPNPPQIVYVPAPRPHHYAPKPKPSAPEACSTAPKCHP